MEIRKPNDMFVATVNNPEATTYDLMTLDLTPTNTGLLPKDQYKQSQFVQDKFKTEDGKFDEVSFNEAYNAASNHYLQMSNQAYLKELDTVEYSPFDITRPKDAKTFGVEITYGKDYNPFKQKYSREAINSITESDFSLRELAQQSKVFDPATNTWSEQSANDLGLLSKLFGETMVYAQWEEDGVHKDVESGRMVKHSKGDWKVNEEGNLYLEKLAGREVYGKQVVNAMDMLTTDGSIANQFDFMDSDSREKSIGKVAFKLAVDIAPLLIPVYGTYYGGVKAALGLASVMPTFYKSFEGMLLGDQKTSMTTAATAAEGWMAKWSQTSTSDAGSESLFNPEQMGNMVADIFTQIYEQRAAASLAKMLVKPDLKLSAKSKELAEKVQKEIAEGVIAGKIDLADAGKLTNAALRKLPEFAKIQDAQSKVAKALSLGYMAMTSSADVYGHAVESGYSRRAAGFATMFSTGAQFGLMVNNRMGDWFLEKATGYSTGANKALMRKSIMPWMDEIEGVFASSKNIVEKKKDLAGIVSKMKYGINDIFKNHRVVGEEMWKNSIVEGVEEVTEQVAQDMVEGIYDTMSYLGLVSKGDFGTYEKLTSRRGFEEYLANFVGGVLGGSLFELERSVITPAITTKKLPQDTKLSLYELIADGKKDDLIKIVRKEKNKYGNKYITPFTDPENIKAVDENTGISQADLIEQKAIEMIEQLHGILNNEGLIQSDDEIVRKAIRDHIIISDLEKNRPEGKMVGLEGLILEDYKTNMAKLVDSETKLAELLKSPEENNEAISRTKENSKLYRDRLNQILTGENAMKYFDKMLIYLNQDIMKTFIKADKATFAKTEYDVDYKDLPKKGIGMTQEFIDGKWNEFLNSSDLKAGLDIVVDSYKALEQTLNESIANYTETGYDAVRRETLQNIFDLQETINIFNVAGSEQEKTGALERFIAINNNLEKSGLSKVTPWTVLQTDMYSKVKELNLIKKVSIDIDGKEVLEDLTEDELNEINPTLGTTTDNFNRSYVENFFKKFPMNPLNVEEILQTFNQLVDITNQTIANKIQALEQEQLADQSKDNTEEINNLKAQLVTIKMANIEDTPEALTVKQNATDQLEVFKSNNNITDEDIKEYSMAAANGDIYKEDFNQIKSKFFTDNNIEAVDDLKTLSRDSLIKLFEYLENLGILTDFNAKFNSEKEMAELINLIDTNFSEEDFNSKIEPNLEKFFELLEQLVSLRNKSLNNSKIDEFIKLKQDLAKQVQTDIDKLKPDLFKIDNYALDFLLEALSNGSADREVYLETKKLIYDELTTLKGVMFTGLNNLSIEDMINIIKNYKEYSQLAGQILQEIAQVDEGDMPVGELFDGSFEVSDSNLQKILINNVDKDLSSKVLAGTIAGWFEGVQKNAKAIERINKFIELEDKGMNLKSNSLYDFIRQFVLNLNSNPNNKINKIFDILEREENSIKAASNITNYISDNIREQDIKQAINVLEMIQVVIKSMATTEVNYEDPYGFIASRQNFANKIKKERGIEDDVLKLKTISSDVATLEVQDIEAIKTKLKFVQALAAFNSGKMMNEQELIRTKMDSILLDTWKDTLSKVNPAFLPIEDINNILSSKEDNARKVMLIENLVFEHNKNKKTEAFTEFIKELEQVHPRNFSKIDKEVTKSKFSQWDIATYFAMVLSTKAEDFHIRTLMELEGDFTKAPFYTQEFSARLIKASTINPELFAKIFDLKRNSAKTDAGFLTIVLGGAGTGKTSAVFGMVVGNLRQSNEVTNIWLSAPETIQLNNLTNSIKSSVGENKLNLSGATKAELWEKLGVKTIVDDIHKEMQDPEKSTNKYVSIVNDEIKVTLPENWDEGINYENLPNLLLIDEITHYSIGELHVLNEISRISYNNPNLTFMKVVGAGDQNQMGYMVELGSETLSYNVNQVNAIFTPRLWSTVRSSNNQKRVNNELVVSLADNMEKIHLKHGSDSMAANAESEKFLKDVSTITALSYYLTKDALNGDYITNANDKSVFTTLKNIVSKNPNKTIGILTKNGTLSEELNKTLSDVGLINADGSSNIKLFTPQNIQGSEVDYFVFDADLANKFSKTRDNIRAFYTYMSRAKNGTIILDPNKMLETKYGITNADADSYTEEFEILTENVVNKAKERRKSDLKQLLGPDYKLSENDNFKWKTGSASEEGSSVDDSIIVTDNPGFVDFESNTEKGTKAEEKKVKETAEKGEFKFMLHSFYSNPNAIIKDDSIEVSNEATPTDLNLLSSVKTGGKQIIQEWSKLTTDLLHELTETGTISSTPYKNYFKSIFKDQDDFKIAKDIKTELILTATKYDKVLNAPYNKFNSDADKQLKQGDSFINLSVKLTYGDAVHYVTLATFGSPNTLRTAIEKYVTDSTKAAELITNIENKLDQIGTTLNENPTSVIELSSIDPKTIEFLTSTRLLRLEKNGQRIKHPLNTLKEKHPKLYTSEIRVFPSDLSKFTNLINSYTFGQPRSAERIAELFRILKNKPYIVVSYKNDIDGTINGENFAKLVPVGSENRNYEALLREINEFKSEVSEFVNEEANKQKTNNTPVKVKIPEKFNVKADSLLNKSQILDILITWATTEYEGEKLIDLFEKPVTFTATDQIFNQTHTIAEVLNNFKNKGEENSDRTLAIFKDVINAVKDIINNPDFKSEFEIARKSNPSLTENSYAKNLILKKIAGKTGWNWNFYNLFAYKKAIDSKKEKDFYNLVSGEVINADAIFSDEGYNKMISYIETLMAPIKGMKFFYSIPIKRGVDGLVVNPLVADTSNGLFSDKFFINVTPESERLLISLENFFNQKELTTKGIQKKAEQKPEENKKEDEALETLKSMESEINKVLSELKSLTKGEILSDELLESIVTLRKNLIELTNTIGSTESLNETITLLGNALTKHNEASLQADPVIAFVSGTTFKINVAGTEETVSPFETFPEMIDYIRQNVSQDNANILVERIKSIISDEDYVNYKNTEQILRLFENKFEIDGRTSLTNLKMFKAIIADIKSLNEDSVKKIKEYTKEIVDKLNKCK